VRLAGIVEFFRSLVSPDFMPHGYCYLWDPRMVWLHVISDGLITLSYYCIPLILIYFIRKNRDLPFNRIFWMFGTFILACGTTHLMEIWNVWHGDYLLAGVVKGITAAVSVLTDEEFFAGSAEDLAAVRAAVALSASGRIRSFGGVMRCRLIAKLHPLASNRVFDPEKWPKSGLPRSSPRRPLYSRTPCGRRRQKTNAGLIAGSR